MSQTKAQLISDLVQALNFTGTATAPANGAFLSAANTLALATNSAQRLTIDSNGRVMIGTTTLGHSNSDDLTVNNSGNCGITIRSGSSNDGNIFFADADSNTIGTLKYDHTNNAFRINTNGSERLRIDSNGRVLIGSTSVGVASSFYDDLVISNTASGGGAGVTLIAATNGFNAIDFSDTDASGRGRITYGHDVDRMMIHVGGAEAMRIVSSGNVGIGTTSPDVGNTAYKVVQVHSSSNNAYFKLSNDTTGSGSGDGVELSLSGSDGFLTNRESANLIFRTAATERMRIDSSGRVGISRTSPNEALEVAGSVYLTQNTSTANEGNALKFQSKTGGFSTSYGAAIHGLRVGDTSSYLRFDTGGQTERMRIDSSGRVGIGTTSPSSKLHVANDNSFAAKFGGSGGGSDYFIEIGQLASNGSAGFNATGTNGSMLFKVSGTEAMRIAHTTGNVGIGTTSPASNLHIESSAPGLRLSDTGNSSAFCLFDGNGANLNIHADKGNTVNNTTMGFAIDNSVKMLIDSSGDVGIGTSSPSDKLVVSAANSQLRLIDSDDSKFVQFSYSGGKLITRNNSTNTTTAQFTLDESGRLGIGTISPSGLLHISGDTCQMHFTDADDSSSSRIYMSGSTFAIDADHGDSKSNTVLAFRSDDSERMRIDSSGNVGIGTTSSNVSGFNTDARVLTISGPKRGVLELRGNTQAADSIGVIRFFSANNNEAEISSVADSNFDGDLRFTTNGTERMRLLSDGDIFLGSASVAATHGSSASKGLVYDSDGGVGNHPFVSIQHASRSSGNPAFIKFQTASLEEGAIRQSNLGFEVSYNNTSDYRLKENVVDISDGITRLKTLKPRRYNWIADETNTTTDGFLAHEVMTAVPQAVTGTKDEVDENGKPVYQQIDQSKLVPLLTAALKEEISKRESLEARVAALEAA